jgi:hypothetical protein
MNKISTILIITLSILSQSTQPTAIKITIENASSSSSKKLPRHKIEPASALEYYNQLIDLINNDPKNVAIAQDLLSSLDIEAFDSGSRHHLREISKKKKELMRLAIKNNAKKLVILLAENGVPLNSSSYTKTEDDTLLFLAKETDLGEKTAKMAELLILLGADNSPLFDHYCINNKENHACAFVDALLTGKIEPGKTYQLPHRINKKLSNNVV